ncbi:MAG TPA: pitrilysin family protein [Gemmatimonadaceae bacterium]|nr:pitrilysin family protein [Gemmatimonadaceae bacterium]
MIVQPRLLTALIALGVTVPLSVPTSHRADDPMTVAFDVSGVRVIQRVDTTSEIVVANLYLLGGTRQVSAQTAGIETLLLEATGWGTRTYPRAKLRRQMARLGTSIAIDAEEDWTSIGIRATRTTFDSTWSVLASRVMEPTLDSADVELVRAQLLSSVAQRRDDPDALLEFLADSFAFADHPYAQSPVGTELSLSRISIADLRQYHREQFVKSRMLLVIVGNTRRPSIERLVRQTLARLPAGEYRWALPDTLPRRQSAVRVVNRALPTNYVLGYYRGPRAGTKEYRALRVASAVLTGQLFSEIRSRRNLTYAVDAPFLERAMGAGGLYVTTVNPERTLDLMRQELMTLRTSRVSNEGLARLVQQFITEYFLNNETAAAQADFLARAELNGGDYRTAQSFAEDLRRLTPEDVQSAAERYMRDIRFVYLGDSSKVPRRTMERF